VTIGLQYWDTIGIMEISWGFHGATRGICIYTHCIYIIMYIYIYNVVPTVMFVGL